MNTLTRRLFLPALAATLLLGTAGARAAAAGIQDDGAFFSEFAKVNAAGTINDVATRLHKDITVQTFASVPEDMKATVLHTDKAATNRGFIEWAEQLARAKKVNGVFILLVKEPTRLQVVLGTDTARQAFTLGDRATLVQRMLKQLHEKKNDDALIDAVNFISTTMNAHRNGTAALASKTRATQQGFSSWLPTIGIVLLIWLGFSLIRGLFRSMSGGGGGIGGGGMGQPSYGGGGFFQNVMSSMFGAAAGMWMYDHFFSSHSYGASPMDTTHTDIDNGGGYTGTDTDYTSSGGSYGDDFGGGDSGGGGDFGGGDSGGGDF